MYKVNYIANNWLAIKINNEILEKKLRYLRGTVHDLGYAERPYVEDILNVADKYIGIEWGETLHELN